MKGLVNYVKEAYAELIHKVSWPTFKELQSSTVLVMVASLVFAVVVLAMDLAFENLMKAVYRLLY
jgi:preprotein translocase subunit SecE